MLSTTIQVKSVYGLEIFLKIFRQISNTQIPSTPVADLEGMHHLRWRVKE